MVKIVTSSLSDQLKVSVSEIVHKPALPMAVLIDNMYYRINKED